MVGHTPLNSAVECRKTVNICNTLLPLNKYCIELTIIYTSTNVSPTLKKGFGFKRALSIINEVFYKFKKIVDPVYIEVKYGVVF